MNTDRSPVGNPVGNQISGKNLFVRIKFLKKIYLAYKNKNAYRIQISYRVFSETFNNQKKSFSYWILIFNISPVRWDTLKIKVVPCSTMTITIHLHIQKLSNLRHSRVSKCHLCVGILYGIITVFLYGSIVLYSSCNDLLLGSFELTWIWNKYLKVLHWCPWK